jgi:hypothetical protein
MGIIDSYFGGWITGRTPGSVERVGVILNQVPEVQARIWYRRPNAELLL